MQFIKTKGQHFQILRSELEAKVQGHNVQMWK